jgi:chromosome segregation ATPase
MPGTVVVPIELLIQAIMTVGSFGVVWGVLKAELRSLREGVTSARVDLEKIAEAGLVQRVGELERHTPKVEQIAPLTERMSNFERRFEAEFERVRADFERMRSDIKDLSQGIRDLASAIVKRTAA